MESKSKCPKGVNSERATLVLCIENSKVQKAGAPPAPPLQCGRLASLFFFFFFSLLLLLLLLFISSSLPLSANEALFTIGGSEHFHGHFQFGVEISNTTLYNAKSTLENTKREREREREEGPGLVLVSLLGQCKKMN